MKTNTKYILASASPRRRELFKKITTDFTVVPSTAEEILSDTLSSEKQSEYLARIKALDIARKYPENIVIGADTSVIVGEEILGKPKDLLDAKRMLNLMSNRTHKVITGCAIVKNGICNSFSSITLVKFKELSEKEIENYILTDEPYDKAGGYGIQGLAKVFVESVEGDYDNVVGLPVSQLKQKLNEVE